MPITGGLKVTNGQDDLYKHSNRTSLVGEDVEERKKGRCPILFHHHSMSVTHHHVIISWVSLEHKRFIHMSLYVCLFSAGFQEKPSYYISFFTTESQEELGVITLYTHIA